MKLKIILVTASFCLFTACAFKKGGDGSGGNARAGAGTISKLEINPHDDSDGDGVKDQEEINLGRNPFVAEIPELKLQFMKDFNISFDLEGSNYQIDSLRDIRSQNFEYRVGDITLFDIAKKETAKFARFDGVVVGDYKDVDLTRVSYPFISPKFIALRNFTQKKGLFKNAKVTFTNTLKLDRNKGQQSIVNPTFNFHYFNYETSEYELLAQRKIEKSVYEGVLEKFDIVLDNLPQKLIEDNFLGKGEFITAEIDDFEIPSMNTTYKKLIASVQAKCIPLTVISPVGAKVYYVALNSKNNKLAQFLKDIYGENFKIENNELVLVNGFSNNLPKFKLLSELSNQTKNGKWFILVNNRINDDVFQYEFKKEDKIVLNYMTGDELSNQTYKQSNFNLSSLSSEKNIRDFEIGEIGQNDELQIILRSNDLTTDYTISSTWGFNDSGGNSSWIYQSLLKRNENYSFSDPNIQKRMALVLNGKEYLLSDLVKGKILSAVFDESTMKISVASVAKVFSIDSDETNDLMLRVYPENHQEDVGVWLTGIGGWAAGQPGCNSADAVCRSWVTGIPVSQVCSHIQTANTNACTGALKDEYRRKSQILQRDLHFDASFLLVNKYN
jgi:hypothetical protein